MDDIEKRMVEIESRMDSIEDDVNREPDVFCGGVKCQDKNVTAKSDCYKDTLRAVQTIINHDRTELAAAVDKIDKLEAALQTYKRWVETLKERNCNQAKTIKNTRKMLEDFYSTVVDESPHNYIEDLKQLLERLLPYGEWK